ncbi:efflux RND transporter periplasmic adaptor subunit [Hyphococcus sp.]|uniref:efflux RND transporter periplasmic adaptor subunit n=1 Tax=Hyphococcus sp. TaxID=2038636 RepID=UPI00208A248F|nr:MAG: secretion protein HylD [Marinicaulis sp.]
MRVPGSLAAGGLIGLVIGAAATAFVLVSRDGDAAGNAALNGGGQSRASQDSGNGGRGGYAPAVSMVAAQPASVGKTLDVIGEGRSLKSVTLTSEATGLVTQVNIAPGKSVTEGDVLLRLDDEQQRIALERARAQYPIAKDNADRYADLEKTEAASALEAEAAFNNFKTIEADMRAAQFAVQQRTIRAPFDGVIGLTAIEAGDYLRAGDVVATLDDTSSLIVAFSIPQESSDAVAIGQTVTARLASGGASHEGVVSAIDSRVDPTTRTLKIEAAFENEDNALLPGAIFAVSTTSRGKPAVSVPGLAIQWDRDGPYIWKRGEDGSAVQASVSILQRTDDIVLVSGEIESGDVIVFEGADRVRKGIPLPALTQQNLKDHSSGPSLSGPGATGPGASSGND